MLFISCFISWWNKRATSLRLGPKALVSQTSRVRRWLPPNPRGNKLISKCHLMWTTNMDDWTNGQTLHDRIPLWACARPSIIWMAVEHMLRQRGAWLKLSGRYIASTSNLKLQSPKLSQFVPCVFWVFEMFYIIPRMHSCCLVVLSSAIKSSPRHSSIIHHAAYRSLAASFEKSSSTTLYPFISMFPP